MPQEPVEFFFFCSRCRDLRKMWRVPPKMIQYHWLIARTASLHVHFFWGGESEISKFEVNHAVMLVCREVEEDCRRPVG